MVFGLAFVCFSYIQHEMLTFYRMYQDKLAQLKKQLQQLKDGTLPEYMKKLRKIDQSYRERLRINEIWFQYEVSCAHNIVIEVLQYFSHNDKKYQNEILFTKTFHSNLYFQMDCVEKDYVSEKKLAVKDFEVSPSKYSHLNFIIRHFEICGKLYFITCLVGKED